MIRSIILLLGICLFGAGCATSPSLKNQQLLEGESHNSSSSQTDNNRWFEIDRAKLTLRHAVFDEFNQDRNGLSQYRFQLDGRIKLDQEERYSINLGASTGIGRNGNWNNINGNSNVSWALKGLSFEAEPIDGVNFEIGSLSHTRNTAVKSFDADSYIVGERLTLSMPDHLYFDDISITLGYAGDSDRPNAFNRLNRLGETNFKQVVLNKRVNSNLWLSGEYTELNDSATLRQSATLILPDSKFLNMISVKLYEPLDTWPDLGYSLYGEKNITDKFTFGGGYASIVGPGFDRHGRAFALGRYSLNEYSHFVAFWTESSGTPYDDGRLDIFLSFDLLKLFTKQD